VFARYSLGDLTNGFLCTDVNGHEHLDGDTTAAVVEFLNADDPAEEFAIDGAGGIGVGKSDEDAEPFLIFAVFGDEIDAVLRGVLSGKNFVEIGEAGFGRADAHNTGKLQATLAAAFLCCQARHDSLCAHVRAASQVFSAREFLESLSVVGGEHGAASYGEVFVALGDLSEFLNYVAVEPAAFGFGEKDG
jgi:hypothetical protein